METTVAIIKGADASAEFRVRIDEMYGHRYVDVRRFAEVGPRDARKHVPTKRGIALPPAILPQVIAALQEAEVRLNGQSDDAVPEPGEELWRASLGHRLGDILRDDADGRGIKP